MAVVNQQLQTASGRNEYAYLLEAMLSFEGIVSWREDLAWGDMRTRSARSAAPAAEPT